MNIIYSVMSFLKKEDLPQIPLNAYNELDIKDNEQALKSYRLGSNTSFATY